MAHEFESGAKRSEVKPRYDLIPRLALLRLAQRYSIGAEKYGEFNWQKGLPLDDTLNHILDHLMRWNERRLMRKYIDPVILNPENLQDDDLAAAMWGICALMFFEGPEGLRIDPRREECPTPVASPVLAESAGRYGTLRSSQQSTPSLGADSPSEYIRRKL